MPEVHSPLGGSVAHRFINCPGSINTAAGADRESSIYADTGTVAHTLASICLIHSDDAWEYIGVKVDVEYEIVVDKDMADAVQVYLNYVRTKYPDQEKWWVEQRFHRPIIHPLFMGIADFATIVERDGKTILPVADYKNGAGVVVEARNNPQLMYYAAGAVDQLGLWDQVDQIEMTIVQPNAVHAFGPVRSWTISPNELSTWLHGTLVPAMYTAEQSQATKTGSWCMFCPALSRHCPALMDDLAEMEELMAKAQKNGAAALTAKETARVLDLGPIFKKQHSAVQSAALARAERGTKIPGWKIVKAYGNRVFKTGAENAAVKLFGAKAYPEPKLLTPAQIEKLPKGEAFARRWAHAPDTGHKLVQAGDARSEQGPSQKSMFKPVKEK